jgi:hypothetical protein
VTAADVARVIETAKAINISTDQRLLLVEPQEFVIDGQDVKEPIGMSGIRLEAKVHIVTGAQSAAENIIKCVRRCGLEVEQLMLNPLASSLVGADRRRARVGRGAGGYWRRLHDRCGHLHQRGHPPYRGDTDCRRPNHQRYRHGPAHAHQGC